ncbi:MAG: hypothetical protein DSY93_00165, partial [SAR324 cluster bacterium]
MQMINELEIEFLRKKYEGKVSSKPAITDLGKYSRLIEITTKDYIETLNESEQTDLAIKAIHIIFNGTPKTKVFITEYIRIFTDDKFRF